MDNHQDLWMMMRIAETALREMTLHSAGEPRRNLLRQAELQGYIKCLLDQQISRLAPPAFSIRVIRALAWPEVEGDSPLLSR